MSILDGLRFIFSGRKEPSPLGKLVQMYQSLPSEGDVPIYPPGKVPDLTGYEQMKWWAIDAYPYDVDTMVAAGTQGNEWFSAEARDMAIRTVADHYNIPIEHVLKEFDVCITPGFGYHGNIMARRKSTIN